MNTWMLTSSNIKPCESDMDIELCLDCVTYVTPVLMKARGLPACLVLLCVALVAD